MPDILTGVLTEERLQPFLKYLNDKEITDVDWNGKDLWLKNIYSEKIKVPKEEHNVTPEYIAAITQHIANTVSKRFNKEIPCLEAETENYRIEALHESAAVSGRSLCIRKTTKFPRMTYKQLIEHEYCDARLLNFLINAVYCGFNIIVCGEPGAGKTEFAKFLSLYIPNEQRVVTIEDNLEWHYTTCKPHADGIEIQVSKNFDYTAALKASLRLNPKRLMLSEVRSVEAKSLVECWTTGVTGISTIHTDDVLKVVERLMNMMPTKTEAERLENNIYNSLDIAVLINTKKVKDEQGEKEQRCIDQVGLFERTAGENKARLLYDSGEFVKDIQFSANDIKRFTKNGIEDFFSITDKIKQYEKMAAETEEIDE